MARPHPQRFAYLLLPQLLARRPAAVRRELSDPLLARELLLYLWDKAAEGFPSRERAAPRGLHLSWHLVAGRPTALLQLPVPQAIGEAHLVGIVYAQTDPDPAADPAPLRAPYDDDDDDDAPDNELPFDLDVADDSPRYFVLEATLGRTPDEAGSPTVLGELRGEHHRHHAPGPPAGRSDTAGRFLQALADLLGPLPGSGISFMRVAR